MTRLRGHNVDREHQSFIATAWAALAGTEPSDAPDKATTRALHPQHRAQRSFHRLHFPGGQRNEWAFADAITVEGAGLVDHDLAGFEQPAARFDGD